LLPMSHLTERKEKNCLNCNAIVQGRYCQVCGQENIVPQDTFRHLVLHFIYDITHFDGKFFDTLKYLVFKPGFLSTEYIVGRRVKYLNPIRMYVFTSAIFFLIFFAMTGDDVVKFTGNEPFTPAQRDSMIVQMEKEILKNPADSSPYYALNMLRDTSRKVIRLADLMVESGGFIILSPWGTNYRNQREYDSMQRVLPSAERDGWLKRTWNKKSYGLKEKYGKDPVQGIKSFSNSLLHKSPYLLFVSLPLFALVLKLLYIRSKKILYAGHSIFSIHQYIFSFILILFIMIFDRLGKSTGLSFLGIIALVLMLVWPVHLLLSMKHFYKQGWWLTIGKMIVLNILGLVIIFALFIVFTLFSIFQL
jgi:hypothetical protein